MKRIVNILLIGVMTIAGAMESMAAVKESTAGVKESTEGESERLRAIYGKNNDPHMIQLVLCINDSNFVCAAEEITKVKKWAFSMYETAATLHINRALAFVQYAAEHNIHAHTINRFKIIIAQACRSRGINYQNEQDYKGSIPYYEKAVEVMAGTVEKFHPDYAEMLSELGDTYDYVGMQKKAEPVLLEAYEIRKKILRKTDPAYVESLEALIFLYYRKKNYIKTDKYLREYAKLAENYLRGEAYEEAMGTIGEVYEEMGNEKKAEMYYSKAEARERDMYALFSPGDETNPPKSVDNDLYIRKRRAAIASFERYLENYDRDDILYGVFSTIIGGNYMEMGDWIRAEENLLEATEVFRHFEPDDIPSDSAKSLTTNSLYATMYALALDELGMLYQQTGERTVIPRRELRLRTRRTRVAIQRYGRLPQSQRISHQSIRGMQSPLWYRSFQLYSLPPEPRRTIPAERGLSPSREISIGSTRQIHERQRSARRTRDALGTLHSRGRETEYRHKELSQSQAISLGSHDVLQDSVRYRSSPVYILYQRFRRTILPGRHV